MPCARVPETRLSTPAPVPGRPPAATLIRVAGNLKSKQMNDVVSCTAFSASKPHVLISVNSHPPCPSTSPVGGSIKFWMNSSCLHGGPLRGCHQVFFINTILQTVRDATYRKKTHYFFALVETLLMAILSFSSLQLSKNKCFHAPVLSFMSILFLLAEVGVTFTVGFQLLQF